MAELASLELEPAIDSIKRTRRQMTMSLGCGSAGDACWAVETDFFSLWPHRLLRLCSWKVLLDAADVDARVFSSFMATGRELAKDGVGATQSAGLTDRDTAVLFEDACGAAVLEPVLEPSTVALADSEGRRCSITNHTNTTGFRYCIRTNCYIIYHFLPMILTMRISFD
uniref:Uncharacterized protein n=1 Tax=Plectus sambesii TaxID=2011161 RepID=A0A914VJJ5_9BILA